MNQFKVLKVANPAALEVRLNELTRRKSIQHIEVVGQSGWVCPVTAKHYTIVTLRIQKVVEVG